MVIITDTTGATEALKVTDLKVTPQLNEVTQLDFTTWDADDNLIGFNMLTPRAVITVPETGEQFRLSANDGAKQGEFIQRSITALAVVQDLNDHLVTGIITGSQSLDACMKLLTSGTEFSYTIHDSFSNFNFGTDTFGGDHALDLFLNTLLTNFNFEWTATNYHIDIYKSIGQQDAFIFVEGDDVYSINDSSDYTTITTRIHGEGKHDDNDKPTCTADYTSPNSAIYGVIDADTYQDDNVTDATTLKNLLPSKVQDYPLIQYTATLNKFAKAAPNGFKNSQSIGDWGYIRSRRGIDVKTRIVGKDLYLQSDTSESTITFGNLKKDPAAITAGLQANRNRDYAALQKIKGEQSTIIKVQEDAPVIIEDGEFDG